MLIIKEETLVLCYTFIASKNSYGSSYISPIMTWTHIYWSPPVLHVLTMFPVAMEIFLVCILPSGTCKVWVLPHFMKFFLLFQYWFDAAAFTVVLTVVTDYIDISDVSHMTHVFLLVHNESMLSACSCFQIYTRHDLFCNIGLFISPPMCTMFLMSRFCKYNIYLHLKLDLIFKLFFPEVTRLPPSGVFPVLAVYDWRAIYLNDHKICYPSLFRQ